MNADGDGVADENDNCPQKPNPQQVDADDDGLGILQEKRWPKGIEPENLGKLCAHFSHESVCWEELCNDYGSVWKRKKI